MFSVIFFPLCLPRINLFFFLAVRNDPESQMAGVRSTSLINNSVSNESRGGSFDIFKNSELDDTS